MSISFISSSTKPRDYHHNSCVHLVHLVINQAKRLSSQQLCPSRSSRHQPSQEIIITTAVSISFISSSTKPRYYHHNSCVHLVHLVINQAKILSSQQLCPSRSSRHQPSQEIIITTAVSISFISSSTKPRDYHHNSCVHLVHLVINQAKRLSSQQLCPSRSSRHQPSQEIIITTAVSISFISSSTKPRDYHHNSCVHLVHLVINKAKRLSSQQLVPRFTLL